MENITGKFENGVLTVSVAGKIDSANAPEVEKAIGELRAAYPDGDLVLDAEKLQYTSSVGLRIILRLKKANKNFKMINVSSEVYEVLDMTGFTEMMTVEKAYRRLSVEGCEIIGQGSNGMVYRLDPDTIIKVYRNPDSLPDIQRERELARKAFVSGIPTAIPYDVVKVGNSYGSVFELLNAKSFAKILLAEPERFDEIIGLYVDLMKKLHSTEVKPGDMPDMKAVAVGWAEYLEKVLTPERYEKLTRLIREVPDVHTMMHGDYHVKNVMMQNGEVLLIDMDTLCYGHPVFEFASVFLAYLGFGEVDHDVTMKFMGFSYELAEKIWNKTVRLYFGTEDEAVLNTFIDKAKVIGYTRMLRRTLKREPDNKPVIENSLNKLNDLLDRVDTLVF